ncbi:MAG: NUDIX domain-containing protein [Candidatus Pacebacteria bacterium]|nr:NUDIX domain-containing protein [Candidatus Paceibacterota bacterium]
MDSHAMNEEKVLTEATLCFLRRDNEVLLARKNKKIGAGKWNGYGGGVESGELVCDAVVRELFEESGVRTDAGVLEKVAELYFHNTMKDGVAFTCRVHVYVVWVWEGVPRASDEMGAPTWFSVDRVPYEDMMPADRDWLPHVLAGHRILAHAYVGPYQKEKTQPTTVTMMATFDE